jgi:anaerobic magnesium-protoporphyrin IX monomethyl ester cyclase
VFRNPVEVVDDLEELIKNFKVTHLLLFDDLFMMKPDNVETFCREIIRRRLKIKWIACTRADFLLPGLLPLMKRSGLIEMALGIESGSPAVLEATGKGISLEDIRKSAGILHSNDVLFYAMAIAGLPGETEKTLMETVDFLIEIDPFYAQFCLAVPFPNTPLFDWYDSRGYILTKDWSKYWPLSEEPVVRTEALTGPQLKNLRKKAYRRFVMRPGYLLRKINFRDPVWTFWAGWSLAARMARLLTGGPVR